MPPAKYFFLSIIPDILRQNLNFLESKIILFLTLIFETRDFVPFAPGVTQATGQAMKTAENMVVPEIIEIIQASKTLDDNALNSMINDRAADEQKDSEGKPVPNYPNFNLNL